MADQMDREVGAPPFPALPLRGKRALWLDPALSRSVPTDLEYWSFEYTAFAPDKISLQSALAWPFDWQFDCSQSVNAASKRECAPSDKSRRMRAADRVAEVLLMLLTAFGAFFGIAKIRLLGGSQRAAGK
jgi:hypothetical protein